ncbi:MAG: CHASE2 domain-containing protein [Lachnospiraceae bacterium]|nr:CHASE2 domain-containing protein [Lachnospiraceae bacterium]
MDIKDTNHKKKLIITIIIAVIIATLSGIVSYFRFPKSLENIAEDGLYHRPEVIPSDIKIIAIDEETLQKLGPYSDWDRSYFADLIGVLNASSDTSPSVIGIDVVFSGTNYSKEDDMLVDACSIYDNIVVASTINIDNQLYQDMDEKYYTIKYVSGEGKPYDALASVVDYGFTNAIYDDDGMVRKTYTSWKYEINGETVVYDSFAYKIASKIGDVKDYPLQVEIDMASKPGEFEAISMSDVLDGTIPVGYFNDCIVLIGVYEEGLMDSYRVPVDYSKQMYGVEMQANYVYGFLNDYIIYSVNTTVQFILIFIIVFIFSMFVLNNRLKPSVVGTVAIIPVYVLLAVVIFETTAHKLNILAVPIGAVIAFLVSVLLKYIDMQKQRMYEMRDMLFSMAEAMAETIEGRTPYNANHTKKVAERCMELIDYINEQHKQKRTELSFTEDDKRQLYLAAMLHDVGKMDIPLRVMDKATKLGNREAELRARLENISLRIENDALSGRISREEANNKRDKIKEFVNNLGAFNCGRPLKEDEWKLVDEIAESKYVGSDNIEIPYLTEEEIDDLHIIAGTLSDKERDIMQSHVVYTDKILSHIKFGEHFKRVRAMAANHHELLNGKGYPKGLKDDELDTMTRILTIMDIYDSLIADDRPYKKPKSVKVAFEILDEEASVGKVDKELLEFAKELYLKDESNSEE